MKTTGYILLGIIIAICAVCKLILSLRLAFTSAYFVDEDDYTRRVDYRGR